MYYKKFILIFYILILTATLLNAQENPFLNLDFEEVEKEFPSQWGRFGNNEYKIYSDDDTFSSGKTSMVIENLDGKSDFAAIYLDLPQNYDGRSIKLTGKIKTENVTEGFAGLWMRIDPDVGFYNMNNNGVTGTTDWQEYEVILTLKPEVTQKIVVGALLVGKGKMWIDDLEVHVDRNKLKGNNLKVFKKELAGADLDHEFDAGSQIKIKDLTNTSIENLELLGRIWGFLKYHHPAVANGSFNWDYELFRILPEILNATSNNERDLKLVTWIEGLGNVIPCKKCKATPADAKLKPNLSWINTSEISVELKSTLQYVYSNRNQGDNYYISLHKFINNPDFQNEASYDTMQYPDSGYRLLCLYRYWNMITYFYPNKHLTDNNWDSILKDYIPKFIAAENELEYEYATIQLIGEINDTHANLGKANRIVANRGINYAPFKAQFVQDKYVVTDHYNPEYAAASHLKVGDIITHINNKSIDSLVQERKLNYPASNEAARLRDMSGDLLRSNDSILNIQYISNNKLLSNNVALKDFRELDVNNGYRVNKKEKSFKILDGNIGYINLAIIKGKDVDQIKEIFVDTKAIIIDIRNYPSQFVPYSLGSYFLSKKTPFVKFSQANLDNPGEFTFTKTTFLPSSKGKAYQGKLVVLINEHSQSMSEFTAMAFRAVPNSLIVGSTTAGADGNISRINLPGGLITAISGIGVYYPDGTETQRVGILPDKFVTPSIEGIKQGKDEVLEEAIKLINL